MTDAMLSFDTTRARKTKHVQIDGTTYEIRPMGAKEYLQLSSRAQQIDKLQSNGGELKNIIPLQDEMFDMITPLFSPAEEFEAWAEECKREAEFAYRQVMSELVPLCMPDVHAKG